MRSSAFVLSVFRDLRLGARSLRRNLAVTTFIIVILTVGLATVITTFSVADGLLLRPLPYPDPPSLHLIHSEHPDLGTNILSRQAVYAALDAESTGLSGVAAASRLDLVLELEDGGRPMDAIEASPSFLPMFGAEASLGRIPSRQEIERDGGGILLSSTLWSAAFGADPGILDRSLTLRASLSHGQGEIRETLPVLGVVSPDFAPPFSRLDPQLWIVRDLTRYTFQSERFLLVFGRVKPGVASDDVIAEMRRIEAGVLAETSETTDWEMRLMPLREFLVGPFREPLALLAAAGFLVFAIAAFNAAGIAAARLRSRSGEAAVRMTLGASRGRLVQFLLAEGVVLATSSGALGGLLAMGALRLFQPLAVEELPFAGSVEPGVRIAGFGVGAVLLTGCLLALLPALLLVRQPLAARLSSLGIGQRSTGAPDRVRFAFVATQIASAIAVSVAAILLQLSSLELAAIDPGFKAEGAAVAWVDLEAENRRDEDPALLLRRLLETFRGHPHVEAAGLTSSLPLSRGASAMKVGVESAETKSPWGETQIQVSQVSPGYFEAMGIGLKEGRLFGPDEIRPRSLVVSRSAARLLFGEALAVGRRLKLGGLESRNPWLPVVGVVDDVHGDSLRKPGDPTLYTPLLSASRMALVVRFQDRAPKHLWRQVPSLVQSVGPSLPIGDVEPLLRLVERDTARLRLTTSLMTVLASVALLLAVTGAYGTIWALTLSRSGEMRVRVALGARPGELARHTVVHLAPWIGLGLAGGAVGAYVLAGLLRAQLFGVGLADHRLIGLMVLLVALFAAGGLLIPFAHHRRLHVGDLLRA